MKKILVMTLLCLLMAAPLTANAGSRDPAAEGEAGIIRGNETLYGIGSVSKVYTAAAVMKLSEEGKIDLDVPLIQYLDEFTMKDERYKEITPRMLLNHSSGLQGSIYKDAMLLGDPDTGNHDTTLEILKEQRLQADPGAYSVYCNVGFTLAELLVERVSGLSFTQYMEQNFKQPLGIKALETPLSEFNRTELAPSYDRGNNQLPNECVGVIGSGGIYSTASDLCRFGRIFTYAGAEEGGILSEKSVREMEEEAYKGGVWQDIADEGSSMAYGLGWDTVRAYPYGSYGIKALTKGGDTTAYHASLTVLPDLDITCSVVSSGGTGQMAEAAVQEILLEYLRETGRIQEEPVGSDKLLPAQTGGGKIPDEYLNYAGWYSSGKQVMKVEFSAEGNMLLSSKGTTRDTTQCYRYIGEGKFSSQAGEYISPGGELLSAQNGTTGTTVLYFKEAASRTYIMIRTAQFMPGLAGSQSDVPFAQRLEDNPVSENVGKAWQKWTAADYLLLNEKYTSALYFDKPNRKPELIEELPGYVSSGGEDNITRIVDESNARFYQQIPAQGGRDLLDIRFYEKEGIPYMDEQSYLFVSSAGIEQLNNKVNDIEITVGPEGYTSWYSAGEEQEGSAVIITAPENGNFFVYRTLKEEMSCTASSLSGQNGQKIYLPEGCRIAFAGKPGAVFSVDRVAE